MNDINKPIAMIIKETKTKLINVCNESGLSPAVLDLILQGIYSEVHSLAERQVIEEEKIYEKMVKDKDIKDNDENTDNANDSI